MVLAVAVWARLAIALNSPEAAATDQVAVLAGVHLAVHGQVVADGALHELPEVVEADGGSLAVLVVRHGAGVESKGFAQDTTCCLAADCCTTGAGWPLVFA